MIRALWTAASGMMAQQLNMDTVSNNLSNVNTTGFKRSRVDFQDLLYTTLRPAGTTVAQGITVPTGIQVGHGVRAVSTQKMFSQGDYMETENPLDVVIEGNGFFQVLLPDGNIAYTRDGAFKRDGEGRMVTSDGFPLTDDITITGEAVAVSIGTDGTVSVTLPDGTISEQGNVTLGRVVNSAGLNALGRNLFQPTDASGEVVVGTPGEDGFGTLGQGFLEMSNVKVVEEMVNMIVAQRAYEVNSKAITSADQMLGIANNLKR